MVFKRQQDREDSKKFGVILAVIIGLFGIIVLRLLWLQVIRGSYYRGLAQSNSTRVIPDRACRGLISDRNGEILVNNVPSFTVSVVPADLKNKDKVVSDLAKLLDLSEEDLLAKLEKQQYRVFEAVKIKGDVPSQVVSRLEESNLPGVRVDTEPKRNYSGKDYSCHVLGYVGESNMDEVSNNKYFIGDSIGRAGVEKHYDEVLRGVNGSREIVVDSAGRQIKPAGSKPFVKGTDLTLTIDAKLQNTCEELIRGRKGCVIAMNPRNGEIYAMVSHPGFNPNIFSGKLDKREWSDLINSPEMPFLNRAVSGLYSPGSTFKIVTATAALEERLLTEKDQFACRGIYWYSDWNYNCWKLEGHGSLNIVDAIGQSCDIFFYQTGLLVKVEKLAAYSRLFGFGTESGLDLDGERKGIVPDAAWKERFHHSHWFPGNTIQLAIGQSYLLATPLQMLDSYNILINNGTLYRPHIVRAVGDKVVLPSAVKSITIRNEDLVTVKKGLWQSVNLGGTGRNAKSNFAIAGKTATIENPHGPSHASFIGFAPFNNPEISAIAFFEGSGGGGGTDAAPVVKSVIEAYFKIKKEKYAKSASKDF